MSDGFPIKLQRRARCEATAHEVIAHEAWLRICGMPSAREAYVAAVQDSCRRALSEKGFDPTDAGVTIVIDGAAIWARGAKAPPTPAGCDGSCDGCRARDAAGANP